MLRVFHYMAECFGVTERGVVDGERKRDVEDQLKDRGCSKVQVKSGFFSRLFHRDTTNVK